MTAHDTIGDLASVLRAYACTCSVRHGLDAWWVQVTPARGPAITCAAPSLEEALDSAIGTAASMHLHEREA